MMTDKEGDTICMNQPGQDTLSEKACLSVSGYNFTEYLSI